MIPPAILFEDDHLLILDKPAGVVVHPTYKNPSGTLLDALPPHTRIVTRLDKLTSGIVVAAKSAEVHARLQQTLASRDSEKIYLAVVRGTPPERGSIDLPLATDPDDRRRRIVSPGGAPSVTEFARLDLHSTGHSLICVRLVTGRRHQIRVHLASSGWPIVGDAAYGEPEDDFSRHALHAWRVAFTHPITGARIDVEAPPPQDFCRLLNSFFAETTIGRLASADLKLSKNRS